jgi:capsular polysaccharide biosynthesis protein
MQRKRVNLTMRTSILMPNKPWLVDRRRSLGRIASAFLWLVLRTANRLISAIPFEINFWNRIINHSYFTNPTNWKSVEKQILFGYSGLLVDKQGLDVDSSQKIVSRPHDYPAFFDRRMVGNGDFYVHSTNTPYNYFHFIFDFILPLFSKRQSGEEVRVYLPFSPAAWQVDWLKLIGQSQFQRANVNGNFSADKIIKFDSFLDKDNKVVRPSQYLEFTRFVREKCQSFNTSYGEKIYIRRSKSTMGRNVSNQAEIEEWLSKRGFKVVNLDRVLALDQISMFMNSRVIVSPHDAGLSNLLASRAGMSVIELLPVQSVGKFDMYKNISVLQGLDYKSLVSHNSQDYRIGEDFSIETGRLADLI